MNGLQSRFVNKYFKNSVWLIFVFIAACAKAPDDEPVADVANADLATGVIIVSDLISRASWDARRERLTVRGTARSGDPQVEIFEGNVGVTRLGVSYTDGDGDWRFRKTFRNVAEIPCRIKAVTRSVEQVINVRNAPSGCGTAYSGVVINNPVNTPPESTIISPASNVSIFVGDSVSFQGSAYDPDGDTALSYLWSFSGGALNRTELSPGSVQFNTPGNYVVSFAAIDSAGAIDPTPDTMVVTVNDVVVSSGPPNGSIDSPASNSSFATGAIVTLVASATDPNGDTNLRYIWDFAGYAPRQSGRIVNLPLTHVGTVNVRLYVRDSSNLWDPTPATTYFRVTDAVSVNSAPQSSIVSPSSNRTIAVGDSINFQGSATDPDGDAMTYLWEFSGSGIANSTRLNPGSRSFNQAGVYQVSFTATDSNGAVDLSPARVTITVNANNTAPNGVINAPVADQIINPGDSLFFSGDGTDADGDALSYAWNFAGAAPNSNLQTPGVIQFNNPGTYRVRLTVTDAKGLADASPAEVIVNVQSITSNNLAPESVIVTPTTHVTIQRGQTVSFSGNGSDPDNHTPLTYAWDFNGGASNSNQRNPGAVRFNQAGLYTVSLTVSDALGKADATPAVVYVHVLDSTINQPPVSSITNPATDMNINVGDSVYFTGTATDPENDTPLSYFWNFDGAVLNTRAQNPGSVMFPTAGVYVVSLTATDSRGASDATPDVRVIRVGDPVATLPDSQIVEPSLNRVISVGDSINFRGRGVDPGDNTPFTHFWNFAGAVPNATVASPGTIRFDNAGIYNITYRVTNSLGMSDPTPATIQVIVQNTLSINEPPNGTIVSPQSDMTIYAGDSLSFSGVGYDPDGDALNYLWSFDGATADRYVQSPGAISFQTPGNYDVLMAVSDSTGLTDPSPAHITVTVLSVGQDRAAPNALIASPATDMTIYEGDSVGFSGLVLDPDNDVITHYFWNFDGAIPNQMVQNPGSVKFPNAGTYRVTFNAIDADGLSDPTPDEVTITVLQYNTPNGNIPPNGIIDRPATDRVITVGDTVDFAASAIDPDNNTPITYRWNFAGAIPNTSAQNPGRVTFNHVGTYRVTLTVTDSAGMSDATPAERFITVQGVNNSNQAPDAAIIAPVSEQSISVGQSVYFAGGGSDPEFNYPLAYYWDFDGGLPNKVGAIPGWVTFNQEGVFDVQLRVADNLGLMDPTPATVRIRVGNTTTSNQPPESLINQPNNNPVINVGDSLLFNGQGIDPEGSNVSYLWRFANSGIPNNTSQSPIVTFNQPGVFTVTLTTTDAQGLSDPTPATISVTVNGVTTNSHEPNGIIVSPATGPVHISRGDRVHFDAQVSDPDGDGNLFVLWNFGTYPITNRIGESIEVEFDQVGIATVTLKVRDSTGLWDPTPATMTVHVD